MRIKRDQADIFSSSLASFEEGAIPDAKLLDLHPELSTAAWLIDQQRNFDPTPNFQETSYRDLMAHLLLESRQPFKRWQRRMTHLQFRTRPYLITVLMAISLILCISILQTTFSQAQIFLPGDSLYPTKLFIEKVQLVFNFDRAQEAQLHSDFALQRVLEIEELILEERFDLMNTPVRDLRYHLEQAELILDELPDSSETATIRNELTTIVTSHRFLLNLLMKQVPYYARGSMDMVMSVINR